MLLDFGTNFSGWLRLTGRAPAGTQLIIRMGEAAAADGQVDPVTNKGARGINSYTFRGEGTETWHPRFSYQGLRYAQIETPTRLPEDLQVVGEVVHSDCPMRGSFHSGHDGLNPLFAMATRTIESNITGLLHDCPQRDERQGWLADAHAVTPYVLTSFDVLPLYRKWLRDMVAIQNPQTHLRWSSTAPPSPRYLSRPPRHRSRHRIEKVLREIPQADSVYTAACTIVAWQYYEETGEPGHLEHYYPLIADYLGVMSRRDDFPILQSGWHGDHAAMGWTMQPPAAKTPVDLVASAVFLNELRIAGAMASILGRESDARQWDELARRSAAGIAARFYDRSAGSFASQGADGMAIDFGFAPPQERARVIAALAADVRGRGNHLTSGVVTTPSVLRALSENGHHQAAYDAITAPGEPGFLWWIDKGYTTFTEHIVSNWPDTSRNQPAWALIFDWFTRHVAGIRPTAAGYATVTIAPNLPCGLEWIDVTIETVRGPIHVRAERSEGGTTRHQARVDAAIEVLPQGPAPTGR